MLSLISQKNKKYIFIEFIIVLIFICIMSYKKSEAIRLISKISNSSIENPIKISQEDSIKIHKNTIRKLKNFYSKYELPFIVSNIYNQNVDISELSMNIVKIKDMKLNSKNITFTKYDLMPDFTIKSAIIINLEENNDKSLLIILDYIEAVTGQRLDNSNFNEILIQSKNNALTDKIENSLDIGGYCIKIIYTNSNSLKVFIKSNYIVIS